MPDVVCNLGYHGLYGADHRRRQRPAGSGRRRGADRRFGGRPALSGHCRANLPVVGRHGAAAGGRRCGAYEPPAAPSAETAVSKSGRRTGHAGKNRCQRQRQSAGAGQRRDTARHGCGRGAWPSLHRRKGFRRAVPSGRAEHGFASADSVYHRVRPGGIGRSVAV